MGYKELYPNNKNKILIGEYYHYKKKFYVTVKYSNFVFSFPNDKAINRYLNFSINGLIELMESNENS